MYSDRQLRLILGASTLAIVSMVLGALAYWEMPDRPDGDPILGSPQLLVLETDACGWCDTFRRKVGGEYSSSDVANDAPMRFMSVDDGPPPSRYRINGFRKAPMIVLFDQYGREVARLEQPPTAEVLHDFVKRGLRRMPKA